ncbi:hypothetical protein SARC_05272 [Sphaeroforma arctica JP610]|uniref:Uncharacterized protein n=1 Tax=Sphaeroforma arctica JP610 TaxID=667725 RepID=A0A0L0G041_9EUKA|nr:hypothetical protein SARC_05272 [Sphaeroforma arctica JP610]KNC82440.1 hypothetical protein SARC_05272 [Sphaeroforma arctica JP610]|eukprot:XP_014156342.1 hypothetical protein SARC_05272 [Sphaeroforma arctica JP610]
MLALRRLTGTGRLSTVARASIPEVWGQACRGRSQDICAVLSVRTMSGFRDRKKKMMKKLKTDDKYRAEQEQRAAKQSAETVVEMEKIYKQLSIGQVVDPWVPAEGNLRKPIYTMEGLTQRWIRCKQFFSTTLGVGIVKKNLSGWKPMEFALHTEQIMIALNTALVNKDRQSLSLLTTGDVYQKITKAFSTPRKHQLVWKIENQIDRPKMVNCRVLELQGKGKFWCQATVRTKNRMTYSNIPEFLNVFAAENVKQNASNDTSTADVTDFVVVERDLENPDGVWRVAGKIVGGDPARPQVARSN